MELYPQTFIFLHKFPYPLNKTSKVLVYDYEIYDEKEVYEYGV